MDTFALNSVYVGSVLGETSNKYTIDDLGINSADIRYQGFSGRYYAGFYFFEDFGLEGSWLHARRVTVLNVNNSSKNGEININSYGILARFGSKINNYNELYIKFGGTYTRAKPDTIVQKYSSNHYSRTSVSHWRPVIEIGLVRRFYKYFDFGVAWHYIAEHRAIPQSTLIGLSLSFILDKKNIVSFKNN